MLAIPVTVEVTEAPHCLWAGKGLAGQNLSGGVAVAYKWEIFQDEAGLWHWKKLGPNDVELEASPQGHQDRTDCVQEAQQYGYCGR